MATPALSAEDRKIALEKARVARAKRAEIRGGLKDGSITVEEVLEKKDDAIIGRMRVSSLLEALPGIGSVKVEKIMGGIGIASNRRLRGLTNRQHEALLAILKKR